MPIDETSHLPKSLTTLLDIAARRARKLTLGFTLSATVISCDQGHCLASFPAGKGRSYLFSARRGLRAPRWRRWFAQRRDPELQHVRPGRQPLRLRPHGGRTSWDPIRFPT